MVLEELRQTAVMRQTKYAYLFYKEDYDIMKKRYSRNQGTKQETEPEKTEEMNYRTVYYYQNQNHFITEHYSKIENNKNECIATTTLACIDTYQHRFCA